LLLLTSSAKPAAARQYCRTYSNMAVHFVVTGFGEFHGVKRNPTQALVEWLDKSQHARGNRIRTHATATDAPSDAAASASEEQQEGYKVLSCTVLEVSATAVCEFLERQAALLQAACSAAGKQPVVLLHLGVDNQVSDSSVLHPAVDIYGM
jgi:hypothetical protein